MNAQDQLGLGIALESRQVVPSFRRQHRRARHDLLESDRAVHSRFASTQEVEIRAVKEQQMGHRAMFEPTPCEHLREDGRESTYICVFLAIVQRKSLPVVGGLREIRNRVRVRPLGITQCGVG